MNTYVIYKAYYLVYFNIVCVLIKYYKKQNIKFKQRNHQQNGAVFCNFGDLKVLILSFNKWLLN